MEKGKVRDISNCSSEGVILDEQNRIVNFNSTNVIGRDRNNLKVGEFVWFERIGIEVNTKAINIRRC